METIEHMQRLSRLGGQNVQEGLPHVATDEAQPFDELGTQFLQPPPQRLLRAPLSNPQQPTTTGVDLIHDGQEVVGLQSVSPVNLVHADRFDSAQWAMGQAPLHKPLYRPIYRFPTSLKDLSCFSPAQPPCPASEKTHHGAGHRPLAGAPGNVLDHYTVIAALDPPRCVEKPGYYPPQRHKQPAALGQPVISGCWTLTHRAPTANPAMRNHSDLNLLRVALTRAQTNVLINKTNKRLNSIQNGLNLKLNSRSLLVRVVLLLRNSRLTQQPGIGYFSIRRENQNTTRSGRGGGRRGNPAALAGFPSEGGKCRPWTFPRSAFFHRPLHPQILL